MGRATVCQWSRAGTRNAGCVAPVAYALVPVSVTIPGHPLRSLGGEGALRVAVPLFPHLCRPPR